EARTILPSAHERGCLFTIPCPLTLVEDYHVVRGRKRLVAEAVVSKMVDILDEGLDGLSYRSLAGINTPRLTAGQFVSAQGFAQDIDQRAVPREVHGMRLTLLASSGGYVQPNQGFSSTRNTGYENDCLPPPSTHLVDHLLDPPRRDAEVGGAGVVARDGVDRMTRVQRACCLDDRRCGPIRRASPFRSIDRDPGRQRESLTHDAAECCRVASPWRAHKVGMR